MGPQWFVLAGNFVNTLSGSSSCVEIIQLDICQRPVYETYCSCMLPKGLIVREPNATAKLLVCAQDEEFVLSEILPTMGKVRS